jgi:hypothetical protein
MLTINAIDVLREFANRHGLWPNEWPNESAGEDSDQQIGFYSDASKVPVFRYAFARWWCAERPAMVWVLLNPGTGDTEQRRRPTLEKCIGWTKKSKSLEIGQPYGGLIFLNIFAARSRTPRCLTKMPDPVGPHNDAVLQLFGDLGLTTVLAWGAKGRLRNRAATVAPFFKDPHCVGVTSRGDPRHPLYVRNDVPFQPWRAS